MEDYPSNSHVSKTTPAVGSRSETEERKKLEKVIVGEVTRKKKSLGRRFLDTFVGGDAKSVVGYVIFEVLIPAAKDAFADAASQGVEKWLYGDARSTSRRTGGRPGSPNGHVSYNRYFASSGSASRREEPRGPSRRDRATFNFDSIILPTRPEAESVIDHMFELLSKYDQVAVSDLYDLLGLKWDYTDQKWGWLDLRGAGVTRISSGYLLDLPVPQPLS